MMKINKMLVLSVTGSQLIASCGVSTNSNYQHKPVTLGQKAKDLTDCAVKAAQSVPVNTAIKTTPRYTTPVSCSSSGSIYGGYSGYSSYGGSTYCTGGQTYGGQTYSYDANEGLRDTVFNQCLSDKGYQTITSPIPVCAPEQIPAGYVNKNTKILKPVSGACIIEPKTQYGGSVLLPPKDQLVPNKN